MLPQNVIAFTRSVKTGSHRSAATRLPQPVVFHVCLIVVKLRESSYGHWRDGAARYTGGIGMFLFRSKSIAWVILLFGCAFASAQQGEDDISVPERAFVATKIYSMLDACFAHRDGIPGFDMDAAYRAYLTKALAANDRCAFDLATLEFVARFRNKHTQFNDQWFNRKCGQPLGFGALPVDGKWVIMWASHERLRKGDVIRSIDGTAITTFVDNNIKYIAASSERGRLNLVFDRPYLFAQRFSVELADGRSILIDRADSGRVPVQSGGEPASQGRWLRNNTIFYIRIPAFNNGAFESTAIELVKKHRDAKSLIVDVRGNGGGKTPYDLIGQLMDREWRTWTTSTPIQIALHTARGNPRTQLRLDCEKFQPQSASYKGRLILLVDRFTCSACEDFVMPFKLNGRAEIVGEATEGSSGQPYFLDFGNGMSFMVGAARHTFPDGSPFESIGILPTFPVDLHVDDLKNGIDPVLAKAQRIVELP
jgi:carboxyl-terminal processing protease